MFLCGGNSFEISFRIHKVVRKDLSSHSLLYHTPASCYHHDNDDADEDIHYHHYIIGLHPGYLFIPLEVEKCVEEIKRVQWLMGSARNCC